MMMMMMMMKIYVTQSCGLRPSVLGQDRSETKKIGLGLDFADLMSYCHGCRHNDLEGHSNFSSVLYSVLGTSLLWRSTVAFTYLKVKSAKWLCLLSVVLVFVLVI